MFSAKQSATVTSQIGRQPHGSVVAWQQLNLLGEYDFSDEMPRDSIGMRPPKSVD